MIANGIQSFIHNIQSNNLYQRFKVFKLYYHSDQAKKTSKESIKKHKKYCDIFLK